MKGFVLVWADAHGSTGTLADHELEHKPYIYTAIGHKVKSDETGVSIAFEKGEDGRWRDVTFVPRSLVLEEYEGEIRKPRKKKEPKIENPL